MLLAELKSEQTESQMENIQTPKYLYKILSVEMWQASQNEKNLQLAPEDDAFIHFSKEDQLERIIEKYWAKMPQFTILKIETAKLPGHLIFEANPGGKNKYYHLYNGAIPLGSVMETKLIQKTSQ